jgi:choline monooxygenase
MDLVESIHESLARGRTLPAPAYTDPGFLKLEQLHVFRRSWQLFGSNEALASKGDYATGDVAGIPVVVVRDEDSRLRGFVNVCRHRAHIVASGAGTKTSFQCPYHAWTYSLDGTLRAAPRSERQPGFDTADYPLVPIAVAEWGPLVFVNVDPSAEPFDDAMGEMLAMVRARGADLAGLSCRFKEQWTFACNWKVFYDNAAECYHCPTVHPGFMNTYLVGEDEYRLEYHDGFVEHTSPHKRDGSDASDWKMLQVWPNWSVGSGSDGTVLIWNTVATDPGHTQLNTFYCAPGTVSDESIHADADWWRQIVAGEDRVVCEAVQRGLESGAVRTGPLLLSSEHVIQNFQRHLLDCLAAPPIEALA